MEHFTCDVLIIGSGGAGLRAAIECRDRGLDVCVISKASAGKSTSTIISGGVFAGTPEGTSPQNHLKRTLQAGRGINQRDLVEVLVEDGPGRLRELVQWGIQGEILEGYLYAKGRPPMWGSAIIRCLLEKNTERQTRFMDGIVVAELIIREGAVGAVGYSVGSGRWMVFSAKAIVLACGGAGALFQRHDNPRRMLGDGYMLALHAGAVLQHLEFVQFYPLGVAEPGRPPFIIPPGLADLGGLFNGHGEDIYEKYNITERPAGERARDQLSQAMFTEIHRKGQEVFLDLTGVSDKDWQKDPFSGSTRKILGDRYGAKEKALRIAPMAHHVMGGVQIDTQGFTSVPGLFAAGEVTGGVHGANRMGGNALTETLVFGKRSGESAAQWAADFHQSSSKIGTDALKAVLNNSSQKKTDLDFGHLTGQLQQVMWTQGGILRNKKGLTESLEVVRNIQQQALESSLERDPNQLQRLLELRFAAGTAALIIQAAQKREESRGAHYREDFSDQDDENWNGALQVQLNSQGEQIWKYKAM